MWKVKNALQAAHGAVHASYHFRTRGPERCVALCASREASAGILLIPTAVLELNFCATKLAWDGDGKPGPSSRLCIVQRDPSTLSTPLLDSVGLDAESRSCCMGIPLTQHEGRWVLAPSLGAQCTSMNTIYAVEEEGGDDSLERPHRTTAPISVPKSDLVRGIRPAEKGLCASWIPVPQHMAIYKKSRAGKLHGKRPDVFMACRKPTVARSHWCRSCQQQPYPPPDPERRLIPGCNSEVCIRWC